MRSMKTCMTAILSCTLLAGAVCGANAQDAKAAATSGGTRTVVLKQSDDQKKFVSKFYELKHVKATDLVPYVFAAVKRYNGESTVQRVTSKDPKGFGGVLVSTGQDFMPFVDELISMIDRPGKADKNGSLIEGTGITRVAYTPQYRTAKDLLPILNDILVSPEGKAYFDEGSNTVYWQDERSSALGTLAWIKYLDRPLPMVEIRVNFYEMRESTLRDIGFDYLAWKNGPGINFLNVGYNAGKLVMDEAFTSLLSSMGEVAADFNTSWNYGGFFTAPQFDMSFIRLLQQSGDAKVAAHAQMHVLNTPVRTAEEYLLLKKLGNKTPYKYSTSVVPQYQALRKTFEGRTYVGIDDAQDLSRPEDGSALYDVADPFAQVYLTIMNPVVCFANGTGLVRFPGEKDNKDLFEGENGGVIFSYAATFRNVTERGNSGNQLPVGADLSGGITLGFNTEKMLCLYEKTTDVEQVIGLPFFGKLPILKYLFSTTTTIKERTYIVMTAEANLIHPESQDKARNSREVKADEELRWKLELF